MANQEFYIEFFSKRVLKSFGLNSTPHFKLSVGDVGGTYTFDQDDREDKYVYSKISHTNNFDILVSVLTTYLSGANSTYQAKLSGVASAKIGEPGKKVLEEILREHNNRQINSHLVYTE